VATVYCELVYNYSGSSSSKTHCDHGGEASYILHLISFDSSRKCYTYSCIYNK